ncbi:DUF1211 domain-containing protein [Flavobacterium sp. MAH-1]|uniref:DUF1211 domain-containing protein n=1 Tax=Flavobacterium agri TaxID=2743471 RepID=A0A7Y8Y2Q7_9FLAO|nr:TMEM175 family protein [Flavobacterium agri]NUY80120.1 DUF1211 domain-containing protein [Flavobacterium agri]NYA70145.1 DUF1211 domain-containing protein [Flavobacterium agri]
MPEKNLQLERLVFFCDAIVAIAITLLVLDIKIDSTPSGHLTFHDLFGQWKHLLTFFLSFFNIANFWKVHHSFFSYIKKIDERLLWINIMWLLFIAILPFTTSLVSEFLHDEAAIFAYSSNILLIATFQNLIWDYTEKQPGFRKEEELDPELSKRFTVYCNLDMINSAIGVAVSFFFPVLAFVILFTKFPTIIFARFYYLKEHKKIRRDG